MNGVKFCTDFIIEQAKAGHTVYLVRKSETKQYFIATRIEKRDGMPYATDQLHPDKGQYFDSWGDLRGFIAAENDQVGIDKCHTLTVLDVCPTALFNRLIKRGFTYSL